MGQEIHNLDNKKACQKSDIPVKIIKDNVTLSPVDYLTDEYSTFKKFEKAIIIVN